MKILHLTAIVRKENPMYVSWCPELNIASQGKTIDEAMVNLKEAIDLYLEDEDAYVPDDLLNNEFKENPFITCLNIKA